MHFLERNYSVFFCFFICSLRGHQKISLPLGGIILILEANNWTPYTNIYIICQRVIKAIKAIRAIWAIRVYNAIRATRAIRKIRAI